MQLIRLTELENLKQSYHIINEGKVWVGLNVKPPEVGKPYFISNISDKYHRRGFLTEVVEEILDIDKFRTKSFVYLYENLENDD